MFLLAVAKIQTNHGGRGHIFLVYTFLQCTWCHITNESIKKISIYIFCLFYYCFLCNINTINRINQKVNLTLHLQKIKNNISRNDYVSF